ncbi:MAG: pilin [Patescibacteria group bacterium]
MSRQFVGFKKAFIASILLTYLYLAFLPMIASAFLPPVPDVSNPSSASLGSCKQISSQGVTALVTCISGLFNNIIYLMMAASVVYIVWGAFQMTSSEEKREEAKKTIYHGIIALFVMISIWGFVNILNNTFGLDTSGSTILNKGKTLIQ